MRTITLSNEVMVSDPCYKVGTWCQHKLSNVLPGEYNTIAYSTDNTGGWGRRIAALIVLHKDYLEEDIKWRTDRSADIGVDSGQCGIFSMESYRNDDIFKNEVSESDRVTVELLARVATLAIANSQSTDLAHRLQLNEERLRI